MVWHHNETGCIELNNILFYKKDKNQFILKNIIEDRIVFSLNNICKKYRNTNHESAFNTLLLSHINF